MSGDVSVPSSLPSSRVSAPRSAPAVLLLVVLAVMAAWLMALPVSSLPARALANNDSGAGPAAAPPPLAESPALTASEPVTALWELDETIPGSNGAILGKQSLAFDRQGNAYAIWETTRTKTSYCDTSRNISFSYRPAGGSWSTAITIAVAGVDELVCYTANSSEVAHSAIAVDGSGQVHVLYVSHEDDNWNLEHSTLFETVRVGAGDGAFWSTPLKVCDRAPFEGHDVCAVGWDAPEMHLLPNGNLIGIWSEDRLYYDDEFWHDWTYDWGMYTAVHENGNWGTHQRVTSEGFDGTRYSWRGDPFALAVGASGRLHVVWDWLIQGILPLRYTWRDPGSQTWLVSLGLPGQMPGEQIENPRLAASPAGGVHALWSERAPGGSVWTLQAAYGATSLGGGQPVALPGTPITLNQHAPDMAVDSMGNAYATWVQTRTPGECCWGDLYFAQRTPGSNGTWSLPLQVNVSGTYVMSWHGQPDIVVDQNDKPNVLYKSGSDGLLHVSRRGATREIKGEVRAGDLPIIGVPVTLRRDDDILGKTVTVAPRGAYVLTDVPITTNLVLSVTLEHKEASITPTFRIMYSQTNPPPLAYVATKPFTITAEDERVTERDIPFNEHRDITTSLAIPAQDLDDVAVIYYHTREAWKLADQLQQPLDNQLPLDVFAFSTRPGASWSGQSTRWPTAFDPFINIGEAGGRSLITDGTRATAEWHEYGHNVMADMYANLMPRGPNSNNHYGYVNQTTTDSWIEGFAEFYALMVGQHIANKARPDLYHIRGVDIPMETNYLSWDAQAIVSPTITSTIQMEEFAVAGLLWDLVDPIDADDVTTFLTGTADYADCIQMDLERLWGIMAQPWSGKVAGSPEAPVTYTYIFDVKHLYDVLRYEKVGTLRSRGGALDDLEEMFIAHGFFEDTNANHVYDAGEAVGTSGSPGYPGRDWWPDRPLRRSDPPIANSVITVAAKSGRTGSPVDVHELHVDVRFPPPLGYMDYSYTQSLEQTPGQAFFMAPSAQYGAVAYITAMAPGWVSSEPLTITSAAYWQSIEQATGDHFLEHTFSMTSTLAHRVLLPLIVKNWQSGSAVSLPPVIEQPALRSTRTPRACSPPGTPDTPTPTRTRTRTATPTETATATGTATGTATPTATATVTATATRTPLPQADLVISKSASANSITAGAHLTYTISITNLGTASASGVAVVDVLPAGVAYAAHSTAQGNYASATGLWSVGTLVSGGNATLRLGVTVLPGTAGVITNTVSVAALELDPNPANNSASVSTTVYQIGTTPTATSIATPTATASATPTATPTATATYTPTRTPTGTRTSTATATLTSGWQTVFSDGFEGAWPGLWTRYNNPGWGRATCRAHDGAQSVWPAADGAGAVTPCVNDYPNDLNAQMLYGPFSLTGASAAEVTFWRWQQTEEGYDYFMWLASADGQHFYGQQDSGDSGGWVQETFDLSDVYEIGDLRGKPQVWIMFVLQSDYSETDTGVFLDDVVIRKR